MTNEEKTIEELERRIEVLEGINKGLVTKVNNLNLDLNSIEDDMISGNLLAKAVHEIQDALKQQGVFIVNDIYAPTKVGGV